MKQWTFIGKTVFIIGLLGLVACTAMGGTTAKETEVPASLPFTNIIWQLNGFTLQGEIISLIPDSLTTIEFGSDGQINGTGGCNQYFGNYTFDSNTGLTFSQMGMTEMACPDTMDQETKFMQALSQLSQLERNADGLILRSEDGQTVLEFVERIVEPVPTLPSEQLFQQTWQLTGYVNSEAAVHLAESNVTLIFDGQGGFSGHGGCNSYFGSYTLTESQLLSFGAIGATKMYCEETMSLETTYFDLLSQMSTFSLDENGLHLSSADGQLLLDFVKWIVEPIPTLPSEQLFQQTWQLTSYVNSEAAVHLAESNITLIFDGQGGLSGHGGCNSYFGSYTLTESQNLSFEAVGATNMYCEETMSLETVYFELLSQMSAFSLDENGLHLSSADGQLLLDFVAK